MGQQWEQWSNLAMGNIVLGCEYLTIPQDACIPKVQRKVADTVNGHHTPEVIGGCGISGRVWYEEVSGRTFIHCGAEKVAKDFGLEISDGDIKINALGW